MLAPPAIHGQATATVVRVASEAALQAAVHDIQSNTTIRIAPGTYRLTATLSLSGAVSNVTLRGDTDNRDDVVLVGAGMAHAASGFVPSGVVTGGGIDGVTIANLTIRDVNEYAIVVGTGTANPRVSNVHLIDAGAGFIAVNPTNDAPIDEGLIEKSRLEYTATADRSDTAGIDLRGGSNWTIQANQFRNLVGPSSQPAGPAILARDRANGTVTDGNTFSNCWLGIAYGLDGTTGEDHRGGIVRNNMFFRGAKASGAAGIVINGSAYTMVVNNTLFVSGTYSTPLEYQFPGAHDLVIANNLLDGAIWARDGASGDEFNNLTGATADMFAGAAGGDLHLAPTAIGAIDRGATMTASFADVDGQLRPSGGYDVGADEYLAPGSVSSRATQSLYYISGRVTTPGGKGVGDVTITLAGGTSATTTTDKYGAYTFTRLNPGDDFELGPSFNGAQFSQSVRRYTHLPGGVSSASFTMTTPTTKRTLDAPEKPAPPTVTLTAPSAGTTYTAPATITLSATASAGSGTITRVDFFAGSKIVGTATASPYSAVWSGVAAGSYGVQAAVTNSNGVIATSAPINVIVAAAATTTAAPSVKLTSPTNGSSMNAPATITCMATASAGSGTIAKVQFYSGSTLIGTSTAAPFTVPYPNVPAGTYQIKAIVTNSAGVTATSPTATVTVVAQTTAPPPPTPFALTVVNGLGTGTYVSGSSVPISANVPGGQVFSGWSGATVADPTLATTTLVMPAATTTVTANFTSATPPPPTPAGGRVQAGNLAYQGAFRVPGGITSGGQANAGFEYSGSSGYGALGFSPAENALLLVGHDWDQFTGKISIPALKTGALSGLNVATLLQGQGKLIDILEGKASTVGPNTVKIGGYLAVGNQLVVTAYVYYDGANEQTLSHFVRPLDLSVTGQVKGPFKVGTLGAHFVGGYMGPVDPAWQAAFKGPYLTGQCCTPVIGATSSGPSVSAFDPSTLTGTAPATALVGYPLVHNTLGDWSSNNAVFGGADTITGVVQPVGTSTVLFIGRKGLGAMCYGPGTSDSSLAGQPVGGGSPDSWCYDPASDWKGPHTYPYTPYVWAYDANDFAAVAAGAKNPWDLKPYAYWSLDLPYSGPTAKNIIVGSAYDPATNRIFIAQSNADDFKPVIHVYSIK